MSDDLVKRLREDRPVTQDMASTMQCALQDAAADRIEELEDKLNWVIVERDETFALMLDRAQTAEAKLAKNEALMQAGFAEYEHRLAKAVEALEKLARLGNGDLYGNSDGNMIARTTLAELKGDK
jgi:hypothetical protein